MPKDEQDALLTSFRFNPSLGKAEKERLEKRLDNIKERVDKISGYEKLKIQGAAIVPSILGLTPDAETLLALSKAFKVLAPLIEEGDELSEQLTVLQAIENKPGWLAATFSEIDLNQDDLELLLKEG